MEWETFEEEFGPLTLHERIDAGIALLLHQQALLHGMKGDVEDFLPRWERAGTGADLADWLSMMARNP